MRTFVVGMAVALATSCMAAAAMAAGPGPEVSRSRGRTDGVVVLWPRVVPETDDTTVTDLAQRLQLRLQQIADTTANPTRVDLRPSPERVCPLDGCKATAVALMLGHQDGGCAALAMVGPPGEQPLRLVPLAGKFQMDDASLPFRAPPEGKVVVTEFVPCGQLEAQLDGTALARLLAPNAPATTPATGAATGTPPAPTPATPAAPAPAPAPVPAPIAPPGTPAPAGSLPGPPKR